MLLELVEDGAQCAQGFSGYFVDLEHRRTFRFWGSLRQAKLWQRGRRKQCRIWKLCIVAQRMRVPRDQSLASRSVASLAWPWREPDCEA